MKPYYSHAGIEIYHGDCREVLPSLTADVVLTDPPYNVGLDYCNGDARPEYREWCESWFAVCPQPLAFTPGTVNQALWHGICSPTWICPWVKKNQNSFSRLGGPNMWEPIFVYGKPKHRILKDVFEVPIAGQDECAGHPCPKSLRFWKELTATFALPGQTILDPFCGSGTSLVAAKALKCLAVGIETEEKYCEMSAKRLSQEVFEFAETQSGREGK